MWHKSFPQSLERCIRAKIAARLTTAVVLGWGATTGVLLAQDTTANAALPAQGSNANAPAPQQPRGGLQVRTVSAFADYDSQTLPNGSVQLGAVPLSSDVSGGGSVVFEWTKFTERSTFSLNYTPSYIGHVRYSSVNAFNHAFSLNATRKLAPRWTFNFSVGGNLSSIEESLFSPTTLSNVASVPSTFDDLAAAMLSAKYANNNPQLASLLTSAPLVESPLRNLLYGERMFTSSGQASLSYSYSPRLSVTISGGGSRAQHVSDGQSSASPTTFLIPNTTSGNASVAISYSLSPLTQLGGNVATTRVSSSIQDAYTTTSLATLGRTLGRRWFIQLHGGVGVTNPVRQTSFIMSTTPHPAAGGSLGFKTFSQTLLASGDRTVSDSYGLGASTSSSANATWQWRRLGNPWWLESSAGWQRLEGNALINTSGWHSSAGFGRAVGAHLVVLTQYAYLHYSPLEKSANSVSQSAVRVSLVWTPHPDAPR